VNTTMGAARGATRDLGGAAGVDARALAAELRGAVRGEVRFDEGSRALYATDASNYRQVPIGVVLPRDAEDVVAAIAVARRHGAPILPRGGGTSLAGQCCNVAVVLDLSRYMTTILALDPARGQARVQPGVVCDRLRDAAETHHLTFAPDPSTHDRCTLGGMIGNNSCGVHSIMAGKTVDNVDELEIVTYRGLRLRVGPTSEDELARIIAEGGPRGELYAKLRTLRDKYADLVRERFPDIPRRVSGYNLDQLLPENGFDVARALVGTEGTCATVLEATARLVPSPPARTLLALGYPDVYLAADAVPAVMACGPIGLEGMDEGIARAMRKKGINPADVALFPPGGGWLLAEFGGDTRAEADERARAAMATLEGSANRASMRLFSDPKEARRLWAARELAAGSASFVPGEPDVWPGWEDSAVRPEQLGAYLRDLRVLLDRYGYGGSFYGHFGHACLHMRNDFDLVSEAGLRKYRAFADDATELVKRYGGTVSGEHGDGQARAELYPRLFGPELVAAFREFKTIWDPDGKMNPGKLVDPYGIVENLRLGTAYNPPQPSTRFAFPEDSGSFARAALRCLGVGKCRKTDAGTMCPSYMVTREERHSTRGRAHLLFEMLEGNPLRDGWRDETVKEALDLCLACKACKSECPINVDMATYKAEFLSHYYEGKRRPLHAYAFGLIGVWARLAERAPALANLVTQTPLLRDAAKAALGVAPARRLPAFAPRSFKAWFRGRARRQTGGPRVLLWPDTFNNYFHPETAQAAVEVLEAAGFQVEVPAAALCCGRPLYDYGMLDTARAWLGDILAALRPQIAAGVPLVGLEPSCLAVFRDELLNLFPNDEDAKRLARQSYLLGEFLAQHAPEYQPPRLEGKALVHGHCHQKALVGMDSESAVLAATGLAVEVLDAGCCGMAGAFGFEAAHYDVSIGAGERVLLPAVRAAAADTLVVADGFSCREQIAQTTERRALHLAEVLRLGLDSAADGRATAVSRAAGSAADGRGAARPRRRARVAAAAVGAGLLAGATLLWARRAGRL
jgi:FAD/FMN-containing dehydrogenase/Fe-S oxidoreductase